MSPLQSICVFCGSRTGKDPLYECEAYAFGQILAENNIRLVYGGGNAGLMGVVAKGALDHGGKVTGIIPDFLISKERIGNSLDELDEVVITQNMHERKMLMFEKSDAFVALPGGIGTLEELVEQLTWAQLGQHRKPVLLADFNGFWKPFFDLMTHMKQEAFIGGEFDITYLRAHKASTILPALLTAAHDEENKRSEPVADDIRTQM